MNAYKEHTIIHSVKDTDNKVVAFIDRPNAKNAFALNTPRRINIDYSNDFTDSKEERLFRWTTGKQIEFAMRDIFLSFMLMYAIGHLFCRVHVI